MENEGARRPKRMFGALLLLIGAAVFAGHDAWAAGPKVTVNIPAGQAAHTLLQFYYQSGVELLYLSETVSNVRTNAVSGQFDSASEALDKLLAGTGLVYSFENDSHAYLNKQSEPDTRHAGSAEAPSEVAEVPASQQANITPPSSGSANAGEMVVTGTHIRGILDVTSPLRTISKSEMKQTAYATVQNAIQSLPFAAGATQGEDFSGTGNYNRGSAINLRGLGAGATLVLINGQRQAQAGLLADYVDVSNIPWSIVDRIEILPDGTSALYGSDAIAGVANIQLRNKLNGVESQFRIGTASNGAAERLAAQMFGTSWSSGNVFAAYQYFDRSALAAADRAYTADSDKTALGGTNHGNFRSAPGNILDPRTFQPVFAIPQGQDGQSLEASDLLPGRVNWQNTFSEVQLMPVREMHSGYLTASQDLGERFNLSGEFRFSQRRMHVRSSSDRQLITVPSTNPFFVDPFGGSGSVLVAYDFLNDLGAVEASGTTQNSNATLRFSAHLPHSWSTSVTANNAQERSRFTATNFVDLQAMAVALADRNPLTAFNPFGAGGNNNPATLDAIRYTQRNRIESRVDGGSFVADGPLFNLPWGSVKLAVGGEHRNEALDRQLRGRDAYKLENQSLDRSIDALFGELSIPLFGQKDRPRAVPRIELSAAARFENYSDFGKTFNPKFGLRWIPTESIKMRASWGTSFKAPRLVDLYDRTQNGAGPSLFPDPKSPVGQSIVLLHLGSNPNLHEETATTTTLGLDFTPNRIPGLVMSLTGYSISYNDQTIQPGGLSLFSILTQEVQWESVITRNPTQAQVDTFCSNPDVFIPVAQCRAIVPAAIIDGRLRNLATTKTKGFDLNINYSFQSRLGYWNSSLEGTRILSFEQAFTRNSSLTDILDTYRNPISLRLRGSLEWSQHGPNEPGLLIRAMASRMNSYRNPNSSIQMDIKSWTNLDLNLQYRPMRQTQALSNFEIGINAINLFDHDPPFVDDEWGYDVINADPIGRVVNLYIQKRW